MADRIMVEIDRVVWHTTMNSDGASTATLMGAGKKTESIVQVYNALEKLGTKTCKAFNFNICFKDHEHTEWQHVCSFCLATTNNGFSQQQKLL